MSSDSSISVRVGVPEVCDTVRICVSSSERVETVKAMALNESLGRKVLAEGYVVKFRGAAVQDETVSLRDLGVPDGGTFVVIAARRRPVNS